MQLTYVAVVILASMIFVLSGMVGYVYWQQTRMLQNLQSLAMVMSSHFVHPPEYTVPEPEPEPEVAQDVDLPPLVPVEPVTPKEDDRLSVDEKAEVVEGPTSTASADDLSLKTAAQLRDLLTSKGIPFSKRDSKTVLLQLLKATA
jgi:hypothetical protein